MGYTAEQVQEMINLAKENNVFFMEATISRSDSLFEYHSSRGELNSVLGH